MGGERIITQTCAVFVIFVLIAMTTCSAIPKPKHGEHKDRTYDPELSDVKHQDGGEHNSDYDHDAFLGRDEAKTFDQLSPEESQRRLGLLVDKIDKDGNGFVTKEELKTWITDVQRRYIVSDSEKTWKEHKTDDGKLTWESYMQHTYGFTDSDLKPDDPNYNYKDMAVRDQRRWQKADVDKDNKLDKQEYTNFMHPEEVDHMKDVVVMETMDDIDKNKDGKISLEEYIADLTQDDDDEKKDEHEGDKEERPEEEDEEEDKSWIENEKEEFKTKHDKDGNGFLEGDEVLSWLVPDDNRKPDSETDHLVSEADINGDGQLTKAEILEKHDLFAGSQATDFGEILTKHDEF